VVDSDDVTTVELIFERRPLATVSGLTRDAAGRGASGMAIYVFPTDRAGWVDFGPAPLRLQFVVSGDGGAYSITLPPGDYFVAVRELPITDSWMGAPILEQLARDATTVRLSYGDQLSLNLAVKTRTLPD